MVQKYIIGKNDISDLLRGKEIPLQEGSQARAFIVEVNERLTNGDVIEMLFPDMWMALKEKIDRKVWWNTPYKRSD